MKYKIFCTVFFFIQVCTAITVLSQNKQESIGATTQPLDYFLTKDEYPIKEIPASFSSRLGYGRGIKVYDVSNMIAEDEQLVQFSFKNLKTNYNLISSRDSMASFMGDVKPQPLPMSDVRGTLKWEFYDRKTVAEVAQSFYANFSLDGGFASFSACYDFISQRRAKFFFLMAEAEKSYSSQELPISTSFTALGLEKLKRIEALPDASERKEKFLNTFGSHYVSEISSGYKIVIYATSEITDSKVISNISADFNSMLASGSVSQNIRNEFSSNNVRINAVITAGAGSPDRFLMSIDAVRGFFDSLNAGKIQMYSTPISFTLKSYRNVIFSTDYPNVYNDFKSFIGDEATSKYGVPRGTIIAWVPPSLDIMIQRQIPIKDSIPNGWVLCDGSNHTPDLINRCIIGSINLTKIKTEIGDSVHTVHINTPTSNEIKGDGNGLGCGKKSGTLILHTHQVKCDIPLNTLPPSTYLFYIMKL